jgi:hypothetical protein
MKFLNFLPLLWVIFALLDPDPLTQLNPDPQPWFQVRVLDPSRGLCQNEQLATDDSCLQSGLTVKLPDDLNLRTKILRHLKHVDFLGFVITDYDSLFIAAIC